MGRVGEDLCQGSHRRGEVNNANVAGPAEEREKGREGGRRAGREQDPGNREAREHARETPNQKLNQDRQPTNSKGAGSNPEVPQEGNWDRCITTGQ